MLLGLLAFAILYVIYNKPIPTGVEGQAADALAKKMLIAVNNDVYTKTRYLEWSFAKGAHQYKWDKENGKVQIEWDAYTVNLNLSEPSKSDALENNSKLIGTAKTKLIEKATSYFNNDSFWLVAPFKVFDQGTKRSLVTLDDGTEGLLVTYISGGTTPGDTYLWKLQPNGFPESYQMWVKIIPIGGLQASWDDWKAMESGAFLPTTHNLGPMTLDMGTVKGYN